MKVLTDFLPDIITECEKVRNSVAVMMVRKTIQDLCERTLAYVVDLDDMYVISGITEYDIYSSEPHTELCSLTEVKKSESTFESFTTDLITFRLDNTPQTDYVLKVRAAIKPSNDATSVDNRFYTVFYNHVMAGAKARLFAMVNKPWTNVELAGFYGQEYSDLINATKRNLNKQAGQNLSVRMRIK